MINPWLRTNFLAMIWYQGEANLGEANNYQCQFANLLNSYRGIFINNEFHFGFVRLAALMCNYTYPAGNPSCNWEDTQMPTFRGIQDTLLSLPNTFHTTAEISGSGVSEADALDNWHPKTKFPIGDRLSLYAQNKFYGHTTINYFGPQLSSHTYTRSGNQISVIMNFNYGTSLKLNNTLFCTTCCTKMPFELFDQTNIYEPVRYAASKLTFSNNIINAYFTIPSTVTIPNIHLIYMWYSYPQCSILNSDNLPCVAFNIAL